jgi:integrase
MRNPFSLYKKRTKQGLFWYVRYWNEKVGKYTEFRSTGVLVSGKKGRQQEAWNQAMLILPSIVFDDPAAARQSAADLPSLQYVADFWKPSSDYVKDCAIVKKKPLSSQYIRGNADDTRLHLKPYLPFQVITLRELTAGHIRGWMRWATENGRSGRRINAALSAMRIAVRYAVANEDLERDPFKKVGEATETPQERGILSLKEVQAIVNSPVKNIQYRAVVLLAVLCGLRRGEIRGLFWGDISNGLIDLTHNFVNFDGLKCPKRGSKRTVPIPQAVEDILNELRKIALSTAPDAYVFENIECPGQPLGETFFHSHAEQVLDFAAAREKLEKAVGVTV